MPITRASRLCRTSIMDWVFLRGHAGRWTARLRSLTAWPAPVGEQQISRVGAGLEGQRATGEVAGDRARGGGACGRVEGPGQGTGGAEQVGDFGRLDE